MERARLSFVASGQTPCALMEMNPVWRASMEPLQKDYPFYYQTIGNGTPGHLRSGRGCRSSDASVLPIGVRAEPAIQATLQVQGTAGARVRGPYDLAAGAEFFLPPKQPARKAGGAWLGR